MHQWPQRATLFLGVIGYLIAWAVGLAAGVPVFHVALRALAAAAGAGALGFALGRAALRAAWHAAEEEQQQESGQPPRAADRNR